ASGAEGLGALLLSGGLSTAASVTELSGRGIGLDIVRTAAERLGGTVAVATSPGTGTSFTLSAPLSLVAVETLGVEAGGMRVMLPLDAVRGAVRAPSAEISRTAGRLSLRHGSETIEFLPLAQILGAPGEASPAWSCPVWSYIVVAGAGGTVALGVDRMLGTASAVLRPLPELMPSDALVGGTTLDAEGVPMLVLNPDGLVTAVLQAEPETASAEPARRPVLVVDDSLTTRMLEQNILETAGYEVDLAASAEDALSAARRKRYALFLVDVEMPGMDGFGFVAHTRSDPALRDVPAVLVSSRAAPEDVARGRAAGASGHIDKASFDQAALLALIGPLIGEAAR
ncbi:MAG: response regulator, partial [Stellaceae bacterium]